MFPFRRLPIYYQFIGCTVPALKWNFLCGVIKLLLLPTSRAREVSLMLKIGISNVGFNTLCLFNAFDHYIKIKIIRCYSVLGHGNSSSPYSPHVRTETTKLWPSPSRVTWMRYVSFPYSHGLLVDSCWEHKTWYSCELKLRILANRQWRGIPLLNTNQLCHDSVRAFFDDIMSHGFKNPFFNLQTLGTANMNNSDLVQSVVD